MDAGPALLTIGYQGASLAQFVACLGEAGVRTLIDVRYQPFSMRPEFRQGALAAALSDSGIAYRHLKALGNPPPSRDAARAGDRGRYRLLFAAHLDTDAARGALEQVIGLCAAGPTALMCLERDPKDCHRLMVADRVAALSGLSVAHLRPAGPPPAGQRFLF
ncbi:MAG: DUF488 domain-containing protein [Rhodospirillales bacterium]